MPPFFLGFTWYEWDNIFLLVDECDITSSDHIKKEKRASVHCLTPLVVQIPVFDAMIFNILVNFSYIFCVLCRPFLSLVPHICGFIRPPRKPVCSFPEV